MINVYEDKETAIFFTTKPITEVRCPEDARTEEERQDIIDKPFLNKRTFWALLFDKKKQKRYKLEVKQGYTWDGASIPRFAWRIIGAKTDNRFLRASLIHDKLCENKNLVDYDRYFADKIFERLLYVAGVPDYKRWLMFHSVDNFQKFKGWKRENTQNG